LSDPLVDNDNCDEGFLFGRVIGLIDSLAKLSDFSLQNLTTHAIANTISVNDEVLGIVLVVLEEAFEGSLDSIFELGADDFLALPLDDPLRPILALGLVDACAETDD